MLKVKQSNKFKKDYSRYKREIEKISNEHIKKECYTLLNKLVEQINIIDAAHSVGRNIDPTTIRENVENSALLRYKLDKIIKDL